MRLVWLGLAWMSGIAIGTTDGPTASGWLLLAAGAAIAILLFRHHKIHCWVFIIIFTVSLGAARMRAAEPSFDSGHVASYNDRPEAVSLTGVVIASPDVRDRYVGLRIEAERLRPSWAGGDIPVRGKVLAWAPRFDDWHYGDRVRLDGYLETPPELEEFSYRDYLARQGIYSLMRRPRARRLEAGAGNAALSVVFRLRASALHTVQKLFPDPEASLLAGILLGVESGIPDDVQKAFQETGTAHIIAISGFNITIIAGLLTNLFGRAFGRNLGFWMAGLGIGLYTLLVGADAAVVRAAIMGGLVLLARRLGRQADGMPSLAAAGIAMSALNPFVLWDVSFQLSFAATLGLLLYAQPLQEGFTRWAKRWLSEDAAERLAGPAGEFLLFTFAAQLTTMPLMAYHFGQLSPLSLIANVCILPVQPAVMLWGGAATLLGLIWTPLGQIVAWVAWPAVAFTIQAVSFFARWPAAAIQLGGTAPAVVVTIYALLFGATAAVRMGVLSRIHLPKPRIPVALGLSLLAVAAAVTWKAVGDLPDGNLHVTVLDIGSGDAVLVESPTGRFVLVDGGSSPVKLSEHLGIRLPLTHRKLDFVVLGGEAYDQVAGFAGIAGRFGIDELLVLGEPGGAAYRQLVGEVTDHGAAITKGKAGENLALGGGARLTVLAVGDSGGVLEIRYGSARLLLVSGADPDLIADLIAAGQPGGAHVALLADGGYEAVNPEAWLDLLDPWLALISLDAGDDRALPSESVLRYLERSAVLRTDRDGSIEVITDGERIWVLTERRR